MLAGWRHFQSRLAIAAVAMMSALAFAACNRAAPEPADFLIGCWSGAVPGSEGSAFHLSAQIDDADRRTLRIQWHERWLITEDADRYEMRVSRRGDWIEARPLAEPDQFVASRYPLKRIFRVEEGDQTSTMRIDPPPAGMRTLEFRDLADREYFYIRLSGAADALDAYVFSGGEFDAVGYSIRFTRNGCPVKAATSASPT